MGGQRDLPVQTAAAERTLEFPESRGQVRMGRANMESFMIKTLRAPVLSRSQRERKAPATGTRERMGTLERFLLKKKFFSS